MSSTAKAGWSVMGTGTIAAEQMVAAIRSAGHEPLWVVSRNREYANSFSEDMKIPQTATEPRRALRDPSVGFVYVGATRERRRHYILSAAAARKHILCDGPIAQNSRVATALMQQCQKAEIILALNLPSRSSTIHQTMRRLLLEGIIGSLQSLLIIRAAPFQPSPARRSDETDALSDIFLDVSVEDIDLARFLTGRDPVEVTALPNGGSREQIAYAARLTGDVVFQAYESFTTAEIESAVILAGDHGALIAHGTLNGKGSGTLTRRLGNRNELIPVKDRDPHRVTIDGFLSSVVRPSTWIGGAYDNVVALETAEAVAAAARTRRTVAIRSR